jgi:tetratricopeptide (TPR) repeat protein
MGGKSGRTWQQIYLCLALLASLSGCSLYHDLEREKMVQGILTSGDQLLRSGDFDGSLRAFKGVTEMARDQVPADRAWYMMGIVYLHPDNPTRDRQNALDSFERVVKEFPNSSWSEQARVWITVLNEAEASKRDFEKSQELIELARQESERQRLALEKSQQEVEKSRQELERTRQIIEKSRQVDIEIEEKRRVRGR